MSACTLDNVYNITINSSNFHLTTEINNQALQYTINITWHNFLALLYPTTDPKTISCTCPGLGQHPHCGGTNPLALVPNCLSTVHSVARITTTRVANELDPVDPLAVADPREHPESTDSGGSLLNKNGLPNHHYQALFFNYTSIPKSLVHAQTEKSAKQKKAAI